MDTSARRRSTRLARYDYAAPGAYFVTICAAGRECVFGQVVDAQMRLTRLGKTIEEEWFRSARIREEIELDAFVVMPNHIHGIVIIHESPVGAHGRAPLRPPEEPAPGARHPTPARRRAHSLGSFVAGFKASATSRINALRGTPGRPIWQRNYYEHVIRGEEDLAQIRAYIENNPLRWELDEENPLHRPR